MNATLRTVCLLALVAVAPGARAASCQVSASDLVFGSYSANSATDVDTTATIAVQGCVDDGSGPAVSYTIEIGPGVAGDFAGRAMRGPGGDLRYNVYADAARQLVWGDGTGGSVTVSNALLLPLTAAGTHVAYGRIPARQSVEAGSYADTLTITISY